MEARGGIGRCYKEMFLTCTEPARRQGLSHPVPRCVSHRLQEDSARTWHGINAVALLARARQDGIALPAEMPSATALADEILRSVDSSPVQDTWTEVTACEAAIALGRYDEAVERAEAFIETTPHGFTVAAFHRQLQKVWQLTTSSSPGNELLPVLRAALLRYSGGQVTVESTDVRATRLAEFDDAQLERVFGPDSFLPLTWYRTGLQRCRAVARIQNGNDDGVGTGFLVSGPDLHDQLPPLVLVTNGHVVPEDLDPIDAVVAFHGLDDDPGRQARFRVARQCWYEPSRRGLDTSILNWRTTRRTSSRSRLPRRFPPNRCIIGAPTSSAILMASHSPSSRCRTTSCSITTNESSTIAHRPSRAALVARFSTTNGG